MRMLPDPEKAARRLKSEKHPHASALHNRPESPDTRVQGQAAARNGAPNGAKLRHWQNAPSSPQSNGRRRGARRRAGRGGGREGGRGGGEGGRGGGEGGRGGGEGSGCRRGAGPERTSAARGGAGRPSRGGRRAAHGRAAARGGGGTAPSRRYVASLCSAVLGTHFVVPMCATLSLAICYHVCTFPWLLLRCSVHVRAVLYRCR